MCNIEYSILYNSISYVAIDRITLGILFFNIDTKECRFVSTKNWKRVASFNDELDIDLIKLQLLGINEEIHDIAKGPDFSLNKYTKFYVNDLKFTKAISLQVDSFDKFISECVLQYLPHDYSKDKRPSVKEQLSFIKRCLKDSDIEYSSAKIKGYFEENVQFDFIIGEYAFKIFRFEGRQPSRLISSVKDWAYTALKSNSKYKVIFVTDKDFEADEDYKTLYAILKEDSYKLLNFTQLLEFIKSII
ncbi:MAG: hypothetical protein ACLRWO_12075 [Clostridium butyricum]